MSEETNEMKVYAKVAWIASIAHQDQRRKSGIAYVEHPLAVANLIDDKHANLSNMCAAALHDVLEDVADKLDNTANEVAKYFEYDPKIVHAQNEPADKLTELLIFANTEGGRDWAQGVVDTVLELTVVWPRPGHDDDPKDKKAKKAYEAERIADISRHAASVTKADKTFNCRNPIPGRDPAVEEAKYQRYFDAVDARLSRTD